MAGPYSENEDRVERAAPDVPYFDNTISLEWPERDHVVAAWSGLKEGDVMHLADRHPLEQLKSAFLLIEGVAREHRERAEQADRLQNILRTHVANSASFGDDRPVPTPTDRTEGRN